MKAKKEAEKGRWQKAIIGILLAVITVASVLTVMVQTVSPQPIGPIGAIREADGSIISGNTLFIGEHWLHFDFAYRFAASLRKIENGTVVETIVITDPFNFYIPEWVEEGGYEIRDAADHCIGYLTIKEPSIMGNIYLAETVESIVNKAIPVGTMITIRASPNFGGLMNDSAGGVWSKIKIKIIDPDGIEMMWKVDAGAPEIEVLLDTPGWDTGTYKAKIESDKPSCNLVDVSSPEYEFTIREYELSIEAEKDIVSRGEDVRLTVTGNPKTYYYLTVTGVYPGEPPAIRYAGDVIALDATGDAYPVTRTPNLAAWIKTGVDGTADVKIATTGADDRTYTINVYDAVIPAFPSFVQDWDVISVDSEVVDVKVLPPEVIFDMPIRAVIGEKVTIRGVISVGDTIDILVDDGDVAYFDNEPVDERGVFGVVWDTSGLTVGYYWIDAYIDCPLSYEWIWIDPDGSMIMVLVEPGLTAEQPRNVIAEDDDYEIEGAATGVDDVDIVLIGPNGYPLSDPGLGVLNGLEITSTGVSDDEFWDWITMGRVNTGTWMAMVLAPGLDGIYGDLGVGAGRLDYLPTAWFAGKTQDQIVAILENHTVNATGSDDLLVSLTFEVETPYVRFNPIENVTIGEPLEITGKTNREPGTWIWIRTIEGPALLPAVITEVEWPTADQGVFSATIDTSDAVPGNYTLEADDGWNTDTATVEIRVPPPPAPEVSISTDKKEYSPGDVINTTIRLSNPAGSAQNMLFKWYFIRDYNNWTKIEQTTINLSANSDQSSMTSISVDDWGNESFCGCYIVSLTNMTTNNIVSVDSASWIYLPSAECKSKTSAEIAKEITKEIEGVELQS